MSYQSFVLVGDNHGSHTCPEWKKALLKFCKEVKPDRRFHVGDAYDFSCLRAGCTPDERRESVKEDLETGTQFLIDYFGQEGAKNKGDILTWGNHDDRIFVTAATKNGIVADYAAQIIKEIKKTCKQLRLKTTEYSIRKNPAEIAPGKYILHGFHAVQPRQFARQHKFLGIAYSVTFINSVTGKNQTSPGLRLMWSDVDPQSATVNQEATMPGNRPS